MENDDSKPRSSRPVKAKSKPSLSEVAPAPQPATRPMAADVARPAARTVVHRTAKPVAGPARTVSAAPLVGGRPRMMGGDIVCPTTKPVAAQRRNDGKGMVNVFPLPSRHGRAMDMIVPGKDNHPALAPEPKKTLADIQREHPHQRVIDDVRGTVGTISSCGIGTNMFLSKVALDIQAKHSPDFIAELDENQYREKLWDHKPITDFWGIGPGTAKRLWDRGITTMGGIAQCSLDRIYDWFGVDGEILYDHAWGREPTTMADVKAYKSKSKSLSSSQVLFRDYKFNEAETIAKEMMDQLCLDMAAKKLATDSVSLYIGYSYTYGVPGVGGTAQLSSETNAAAVILPAIGALYRRIVNPAYGIRRVCLACNNVVEDHGTLQLNIFEDATKQIRNKALQEAMLGIRAKYGKNSILRGISYTPESTARERNLFIGGHKSGNESSKGTDAKIQKG